MPMYTYNCETCDEKKEMLVKMEARDNATCPDCGGDLVRGIDSPGLVYAPTSSTTGLTT